MPLSALHYAPRITPPAAQKIRFASGPTPEAQPAPEPPAANPPEEYPGRLKRIAQAVSSFLIVLLTGRIFRTPEPLKQLGQPFVGHIDQEHSLDLLWGIMGESKGITPEKKEISTTGYEYEIQCLKSNPSKVVFKRFAPDATEPAITDIYYRWQLPSPVRQLLRNYEKVDPITRGVVKWKYTAPTNGAKDPAGTYTGRNLEGAHVTAEIKSIKDSATITITPIKGEQKQSNCSPTDFPLSLRDAMWEPKDKPSTSPQT